MTKGTKAQQARAAENGQHDLASEDAEQLKHYYHQMLLLRLFEERTSEMYTKAKIGGYCHLNLGEEATIVGLMAALTPDDYIFTNYREHGYVIARGVEVRSTWMPAACGGGRSCSIHSISRSNAAFWTDENGKSSGSTTPGTPVTGPGTNCWCVQPFGGRS